MSILEKGPTASLFIAGLGEGPQRQCGQEARGLQPHRASRDLSFQSRVQPVSFPGELLCPPPCSTLSPGTQWVPGDTRQGWRGTVPFLSLWVWRRWQSVCRARWEVLGFGSNVVPLTILLAQPLPCSHPARPVSRLTPASPKDTHPLHVWVALACQPFRAPRDVWPHELGADGGGWTPGAGAEPVPGLPVVCGVLWWLYYDYSTDLSVALDTERDNVTCLLGFAVVATVLTVRNACGQGGGGEPAAALNPSAWF